MSNMSELFTLQRLFTKGLRFSSPTQMLGSEIIATIIQILARSLLLPAVHGKTHERNTQGI
jgi:hypothetical protein